MKKNSIIKVGMEYFRVLWIGCDTTHVKKVKDYNFRAKMGEQIQQLKTGCFPYQVINPKTKQPFY